MDFNMKLNELIDFAFSRRNYVRGSTSSTNLSAVNPAGLGRAFIQDLSDIDILNFALTLEHLEANMYDQMLATGILTGKEQTYFQNFGDHEAAHVEALTNALRAAGATPVEAQANYNFPPFNNRGDILNFARTAEETGVGAYQGAASSIQSDDYLAVAGSIVQVEARHAAIVRVLIGTQPAPNPTTESLSVQQVMDIIGPILG